MFIKNSFENVAWQQQDFVAGIDEVGRGPVFGPLVLACVILPIPENIHDLSILKDSKLLSEKARSKAFLWITQSCLWTDSVLIHPFMVDSLGINIATEFAIKKLIHNIPFYLQKKLKTILIDHVRVNIASIKTNIKIISAAKGELWSSSIAAASIFAKVKRDSLLQQLHPLFDIYDLSNNKGYGTAKHTTSLKKHGLSILHRKTYCKTLLQPKNINLQGNRYG